MRLDSWKKNYEKVQKWSKLRDLECPLISMEKETWKREYMHWCCSLTLQEKSKIKYSDECLESLM